MLIKDKIEQIRADFPILGITVHGKPLIYFDNAATTQKPRQVIEKMTEATYTANSNIHRGVHYLSQKATIAHEDAREVVRSFINAAESREIVFTRGTTEAINLIAFSFGETFCKPGDEIIVSEMEHHSNIVPWQMLCKRKGLVLRVVPIDDAGVLDMDAYATMLNEKTKIVSIAYVSNVLGTINPVEEIIQLAHDKNIPVLIDGAQALSHLKTDVQALDVDFLVFSGHKMYGPTGIGALYGKAEWLEKMEPYQGGGEMIDTVSFTGTTYNEIPFKFEAGTPDFISSVGFAEAILYMQSFGIDHIKTYEDYLLTYATEQLLAEVEGVRIIGTAASKCSVLSFLVNDIHPFDIGTLLDQLGIAVRTGHHCAQPLMERYNISGTIRASFSFYNTIEEVDLFVKAVKRVALMFG